MKCFAAFSILAALGAGVAWGLFSIIQAGVLLQVLIAIAVSVTCIGVIAAIMWALITAIECVQDWMS